MAGYFGKEIWRDPSTGRYHLQGSGGWWSTIEAALAASNYQARYNPRRTSATAGTPLPVRPAPAPGTGTPTSQAGTATAREIGEYSREVKRLTLLAHQQSLISDAAMAAQMMEYYAGATNPYSQQAIAVNRMSRLQQIRTQLLANEGEARRLQGLEGADAFERARLRGATGVAEADEAAAALGVDRAMLEADRLGWLVDRARTVADVAEADRDMALAVAEASAAGHAGRAALKAVGAAQAQGLHAMVRAGAETRTAVREGAAAAGEAVAGQGRRGVARGSWAPQAVREIGRSTSERLAVTRARLGSELFAAEATEHRALETLAEAGGRAAAAPFRLRVAAAERDVATRAADRVGYLLDSVHGRRATALDERADTIAARRAEAVHEGASAGLRRDQAVYAREKEADSLRTQIHSADDEYRRAVGSRDRARLDYDRARRDRAKATSERAWNDYALTHLPGVEQRSSSDSVLAAGLNLFGALVFG